MKATETVELLDSIKGACPKFNYTEQTVKMWHKALKDISLEDALTRLSKHIHTSPYEPSLHDILKFEGRELKKYKDMPRPELSEREWEFKERKYQLLLKYLEKPPSIHDQKASEEHLQKYRAELAQLEAEYHVR
jgi:hypothetical protein